MKEKMMVEMKDMPIRVKFRFKLPEKICRTISITEVMGLKAIRSWFLGLTMLNGYMTGVRNMRV